MKACGSCLNIKVSSTWKPFYECVQTSGLRYKLQKRFRRLNSADSNVFRPTLKQFWKFMHEHPLCAGVLEGITTRLPEADAEAEKICDQNQSILFGDEFQSVAVTYFVIRRCLNSKRAF
jgi:mannose/fructose/N-acetylgalactosamine-specific phosphotransferase system component IID